MLGNSLALLQEGAALVIVPEGGRPALYVHAGHLAKAPIQLSDSILKIAKAVK